MTCGTRKARRNWRTKRQEDAGFALIEKMFWYYNKIKQAVNEIHAEIGYYQGGKGDTASSSTHSFISDPTANMAIKHSAKVEKVIINSGNINEDVISRPEDWLFVIEQTYRRFPDTGIVGKVLRKRFTNEPWPTTCIDLNISKDKYYASRDTGIRYARECAIQIGLIKVF